jgi:hypothetical protein
LRHILGGFGVRFTANCLVKGKILTSKGLTEAICLDTLAKNKLLSGFE